MCLEDFLESSTRLRISELPHFWTWDKFALDLGRLINHYVAQGADAAKQPPLQESPSHP